MLYTVSQCLTKAVTTEQRKRSEFKIKEGVKNKSFVLCFSLFNLYVHIQNIFKISRKHASKYEYQPLKICRKYSLFKFQQKLSIELCDHSK